MSNEKRYQQLTFNLDKYSWGKTEEQARAAMWNDISEFLQILFKNDNIAVIYDDDCDIIVVQYEHDENKDPWGGCSPCWMTDEEYWKGVFEDNEDIDGDKEQGSDKILF